MKIIKCIIEKNSKIIKYLFCSIASAMVEVIVGWILLQIMSDNIVITNTCSIIMGAIAHYFLTLIFVFHQKNTWRSVTVYLLTFLFGLFLQNGVIWVFYDHLLVSAPYLVRYLLSKGFSLAIPFLAVYYVRNYLNTKLLNSYQK